MASSPSRSGRSLVVLAVAMASLTVATSKDTTNPFRWLDCPSPPPSPSPAPPPASSINSTFKSNVVALLEALPSAAAPTGFASLSRGGDGADDLAVVRGLCRGDSAPGDCAGCLHQAVLHIKRHCSSNRRAGVWYDRCFLTYADTNESTAYEEGFRQGLHSGLNVSGTRKMEVHNFNSLIGLMSTISDRAAHGGSSEIPMFETGEAVFERGRGAPNGTMYGMVQCMRDQTASDCALCLWNSMDKLSNGRLQLLAGVVLGYNCYMRLEFYAYYNLALDVPSAEAPPPPAQAPAPTSSFLSTIGETHRIGDSVGAIAGGVGGGIAALLLGVVLYVVSCRRRTEEKGGVLPFSEDSTLLATTSSSKDKIALSSSQAHSAPEVRGITVDKSVEFSYEELFNATQGFSMSNKIGQGGLGAVYYAELRGQKVAIKKMSMQATNEFLAELKVLTHVHHMNLVRLIGYCIKSSLFIVYEYIENGNLSQRLRGTGYEPLSWAARVQIALDSARGLEYIHEHTVPVYIHRDIKSANILIEKTYRAKVADFGLTKLMEVGNTPLPMRGIVGTFGYMPPEYARYYDVNPKVDVYGFGVVLFELISAKGAVVRPSESCSDSKGLVHLFEEALSTPDPKEGLQRLIDPALGEDYPMDSILEARPQESFRD